MIDTAKRSMLLQAVPAAKNPALGKDGARTFLQNKPISVVSAQRARFSVFL
jgi:hypothetical protein